MSTATHNLFDKLRLATSTIYHAENSLERRLETGEVRDFLMDNFEDWSRDDIEAIRAEFLSTRESWKHVNPKI